MIFRRYKKHTLHLFVLNRVWIGLLLFLGATSCLYPPANDNHAEGKKEITYATTRAFSHPRHEEVLKKQGFRCVECHLYKVAYQQKDAAVNKEIARVLTRSGLESCHYCHIKHPEKGKKIPKCMRCHRDLRRIRPENHRVGWRSSHGVRISLTENECSRCHSNRFCLDCHAHRDEAKRSYHSGSAIVSHPIEARSNPAKCQRCHQASFCKRCHRFGRF